MVFRIWTLFKIASALSAELHLPTNYMQRGLSAFSWAQLWYQPLLDFICVFKRKW